MGRELAVTLAEAGGEDTSDWPDISEDLVEAWGDGEAFYLRHNGFEDENAWLLGLPLTLNDAHIALLRKARFVWETVEAGAPMLDPKRPYGERDLMRQLQAAFGDTDELRLAAGHVEMVLALAKLFQHGRLAPGAYRLGNISADDLRQAFTGYGDEGRLSDEQIGLDEASRFVFTDEHRQLLKAMMPEWSNRYDNEDRMDMGEYPGAAIDPKRPYGDMSYIEIDMAKALGCLPPPPSDGSPARLPEALEERLGRLHFQMLGAVQVFVEHAEIKPARYE